MNYYSAATAHIFVQNRIGKKLEARESGWLKLENIQNFPSVLLNQSRKLNIQL